MDDKAREIRNAYFREWRAKNKDKVKAANARYWNKKAARDPGPGEPGKEAQIVGGENGK